MDYILDYLDPALIPSAIVLYFVGNWIKASRIRDELIPWLLIPIGIGIVGLWQCTQGIPAGGQWIVLIYNAIVQGILCAALAVTGDQLAKQAGKLRKEGIISQTDKEK